MKDHNNFKELFTDFFDLPKDIVLNLPRIIIIGNTQFYVENHRGISEYSEDTIRIKITGGELKVIGTNLVVRNIFEEEILIEGDIEKIEFQE
ncbi:sporulation protein YqfC [Natranaerobius thermophilus]|uniref:Sporulation protein YqfC n=1 Tax=Natranaerobius thermophilus (strain ATCC BAA-1301 / DSM 18059 / JW/NM-WN-LF) TaxID=457570 RepID=B2A1M4_NATTJ|nr:sporulation protein YqfC [Natranaerobius thermophilus]ACB84779.1 sporulation protein YqfC [Natranaerobius thermophilus JW/NM-WN-LF]